MTSLEDTQQLHTADLEPWRGVSVSDSGDELIGITLNGTYVVERLLGEGGMGRVYLARHTRIAQKRVAVKVLHTEFANSPQVLARFQREAEAAAAISHPNVVAVLDVDITTRGMPYLVCEYLDGVDLSEHLKEVKHLDVVDALSVTRQLCRGLRAAHASGVIHRDLKPANVFLVGDFGKGAPRKLFAKLLDFGLSRFHGSEGDQNLTKTGFIMGTPTYMAPEQARGHRVDHRADVYGLGTILYTILTGRAPFDEETPQATILAVLNSEPPRPRSIVSSIPPHLELVVERQAQPTTFGIRRRHSCRPAAPVDVARGRSRAAHGRSHGGDQRRRAGNRLQLRPSRALANLAGHRGQLAHASAAVVFAHSPPRLGQQLARSHAARPSAGRGAGRHRQLWPFGVGRPRPR